MESDLPIHLDRGTRVPIATQIAAALGAAIHDGRLAPGARLPSWHDLAVQLGVARGIACDPSQVFVTNGFAAALGLALRALRLDGCTAWVEDPGYASARDVLAHYGVTPVPVRVDDEGLDVDAGIAHAPDAALAVVTPGQQAPLGMTLSLARRHALLDWAAARGAWIVEDDYLGELQLQARATPALAARDHAGRVLHIGTFSKTINPALRTAFLVVPPALVARVADVADASAATPAPAIQFAIEEFLRDGHYLRHLRRMKRVYAERRATLCACLRDLGLPHAEAGLSVLLPLPDGVDDAALAARARTLGLAPSSLSWWRVRKGDGAGALLLGVTNVPPSRTPAACALLASLLR